MAKNSRAKGARGEREWARWLTDRGVPARRGQQYSGTADSPDVVADMPGWHPEVKRVEALNIYDAIEKAATEAAPGSIPYVAHRRNHKDWLITLRAEDWLKAVTLSKPPTPQSTNDPTTLDNTAQPHKDSNPAP